MNEILDIQHLSVTYHTYEKKAYAVRDVSFQLHAGKTVALVGESGCGKSVTAKAIMGLVQAPGTYGSDSRILYKGRNLRENSEQEWNSFRGKDCAMIFQDASVALNPTMRIREQICEPLENHNRTLSKEERYHIAEEMLKLVEIPDTKQCLNKYPFELSGGMRQRVVIAMAMVTQPEILIADEPTTALDVTTQAQIINLMKELQMKMGMAILMITHDLGIVAEIADEVVVMYAGKVVEQGGLWDIFYHPRHPYTWALLNAVPGLDERGKKPLMTIEGSVPDITNLSKGCAFYDRCRYAMHICRDCQPLEEMCGKNHKVACWLTDPRAGVPKTLFERGGSKSE